MYYYILSTPPVTPHLICKNRDSYLVGSPLKIEGQSMLTEDALQRFCYDNRLDYGEVKKWTVKYSIRGSMLSDGTDVLSVLNQYPTIHLSKNQGDSFTFETWVESPIDRDSLFSALKPLVDLHGEYIDWHECTHNMSYASKPCLIAETYVRG